MLTGECQFHISTPLGIEPGSLMTGSKAFTHWTSEEGRPAARLKLGQKSCVRSCGIITLSAQWPSDSLGRSPPQRGHNDLSYWGHQCSETKLTGDPQFHISTTLGIAPAGPSWREAKGWPTGLVWLCVNAVRLQVLHTLPISYTQNLCPLSANLNSFDKQMDYGEHTVGLKQWAVNNGQ
jgi:hypothetical protein